MIFPDLRIFSKAFFCVPLSINLNFMKKNSTPLRRKVSTLGGKCFMLFVFLWIAHSSHAQIHLVKDINQWADPYSNDFNSIHALGDNVFFHAAGGFYYTDGTSDGTVLLQNFDYVRAAKSYNGNLYYTPGEGLWKSDGTPAGTVLLKNINPSFDYVYNAGNFTELNGILYFTASQQATGIELWRTDGTEAGTYLVKDIKAGVSSSNPQNLKTIGNKLFFTAPSGSNKGIELWVSDGTSLGTTMVYDINPGSSSSDPANLIDVNGICFFTAKDPIHGKELWRSDGTAAGTRLVKDIKPGSSGTVSKLASVNGWAFFEAHDGVHGKELWKSDGTEAGTVMVKDIAPGATGSSGIYVQDDVFSHNGIYYFIAYYKSHRMWRSDGTEAGTYPITPEGQSEFHFLDFNFTVFNDQVYFFAQDSWTFTQLWKTDGTIGGTVIINPKLAYFDYGTYARLEACQSKLFMISQEYDDVTGAFSPTKLRESDGTLVGTHDVFTLPGSTLGSYPVAFVPVNDIVLFRGTEGNSHFNNLYRTDGTTAGTTEVKKFKEIYNLTSFSNDKAIFTGYIDYAQGPDLWITDGTPAGTQNITPPGANVTIRGTAKLGNDLLIVADDNFVNNDRALYKTDGTLAGTVVVKNFAGYAAVPSGITAFGSKALFAAGSSAGVSDYELWISDGTSAGTQLLLDLRAGGSSYPHGFAPVGTKMVFLAYDGAGNELFVTDGTATGTSLVRDFSSGSNDIGELTPLNDKVIFAAAPNQLERALWTSDGTTIGTAILKDFYPGNESIDIVGKLGSELILLVTNGNTQVWKTDGTTAGTVMVKDLGLSFTSNTRVAVLENVMYLGRPFEGGGLWRTDGTECGTYLIDYPGVLSVDEISVVGSTVIFNGNVNEAPYASLLGPELYGYTPETTIPCATLAGRTSQTIDREAEATAEELSITSYPNPFHGEIAVEIKGDESAQYRMEVFSLSGRVIQSSSNLSFNRSYRMGSQWTQGVYVLKANVGGKIITKKIVKMY
jgi:ELWxxDGT repeat protein